MSFLKINNLSVDYQTRKETVYAAKSVNIEVSKGEILGLVGESGSGKSTVGNAIINLIDEPGKVSSGSVILGDLNIHENSESIVKYRGNKIGLIFQDPQTSLNPILTVGEQLIETIQTHLKLSKEEAKNKSINLLKEVGIKDAETRFDNYPHQFSGYYLPSALRLAPTVYFISGARGYLGIFCVRSVLCHPAAALQSLDCTYICAERCRSLDCTYICAERYVKLDK